MKFVHIKIDHWRPFWGPWNTNYMVLVHAVINSDCKIVWMVVFCNHEWDKIAIDYVFFIIVVWSTLPIATVKQFWCSFFFYFNYDKDGITIEAIVIFSKSLKQKKITYTFLDSNRGSFFYWLSPGRRMILFPIDLPICGWFMIKLKFVSSFFVKNKCLRKGLPQTSLIRNYFYLLAKRVIILVTIAEYSAALSSTYPAANAAVLNTRSVVSLPSTDSLSISCNAKLRKM